ncbi:MAG: mechanosensitive ion channel family protein [Actinobacteria bacterium]|nr:mechanosensitive ion channel family protein [Actinomycetota bacterium]
MERGCGHVSDLAGFADWARSTGLQLTMLVTGVVLAGRLVAWLGGRITAGIDRRAIGADALVRSETAKHRHAVADVVTWVVIVLLYCIATVGAMQLLGLPLSGFIAPATVAGVAIGFGAQRIVQDLLAGFFLIAERQYGYGDVIRLSVPGVATPITGTVEEVTLRTTRTRSIDGEVITTPNGQIVQVVNLSRDWARAVVDVPLPSRVDIDAVNRVLKRTGEEAFDDPDLRRLLLDPPTVMGVESLAVDQFNIRMVARTLPGKQFDVGRSLRARSTIALAAAGITPSDVEVSASSDVESGGDSRPLTEAAGVRR